jgi:hypothetical protein
MTGLPVGLIPAPAQTSNRRIIDRLKEWGCLVVKTKGDWTVVESPWGGAFEVRSPQCHNKNGIDTIQEFLSILGMSWNDFMGTDLTPFTPEEKEAMRGQSEDASQYLRVLTNRAADGATKQRAEAFIDAQEEAARQIEQERKRKQRRQEREARMAAADAERQARLQVVQEEADAKHDIAQAPEPQRRRIINIVMDQLIESGEPMSIDRLMGTFGEDQPNRNTVQGACLRLVDQGIVDRVKPGVYQAKPQHQRQDVRIGVQGAVQGGVAAAVAPDQAGPQNAVQRLGGGRIVPDTLSEAEETINDVLDLMFPDGFKARHLPLIDAWRRATIDLMQEIGRA